MSAAAMLCASCAKQELLAPEGQQEVSGYYLVMDGNTGYEDESETDDATRGTKVAIGEKDGDQYPLYWRATDKIVVYNGAKSVTASAMNVAGDTQAYAKFKSDAALDVTGATGLVIGYPETVKYNATANTLTMTLPREQVQNGNDNSEHIGKYALAYGTATVETDVTNLPKGEEVAVSDFALEQKLAFVKVSLLSTTEYSDYEVVGVKLYSNNRSLSGVVTYDIATGKTTSAEYDHGFNDDMNKTMSMSVGANFKTPELFNGKKTFYFTSAPIDEGRYIDLVIYLRKGSETVTLPKALGNNVKLVAGALTEIAVKDVTSKTNSYDWFEPVETRDALGYYAYGPQNTYVVDWNKKSGGSPTQLKLDVKARGDYALLHSRIPAYYAIYTPSNRKDDVTANTHFVYLESQDESYGYSNKKKAVNSDCTIDIIVNNQTSKGCWGQVGVYDKDNMLLWTYMIWGHRTDNGDPIIAVQCGNYEIMDRALGTTLAYDWAENHEWGFDEQNIAFFQWGRKDPFTPEDFVHVKEIASEADNFLNVINSANTMYVGGSNSGDWTAVHNNRLWGGNVSDDVLSASNVGHKTIYDPCPEGWRVPDPGVFAYINSLKTDSNDPAFIMETTVSGSAQKAQWVKTWSRHSAPKAHESVLRVPTSTTGTNNIKYQGYDFWPYHGAMYGSKDNTSWTNNLTNRGAQVAMYWSNWCASDTEGVKLEYAYFSSGNSEEHGTRNSGNKRDAYPIRCQKDDENR